MNDLIQQWSGESVVISYHQPTETWIFIAIHDTTLGPANGGCRMRVYDSPEDGLRDAMRLAEGMTYKWAGIGFDFGGGKSVLAIPRPLEPAAREELLRYFGKILESLKGAYSTGEDLGTTPEDMAILAQESQWVHGVREAGAPMVDPGPFTAFGVFMGIRAAVGHIFESPDLHGRSVLIQGVGDVGDPLAHRLAGEGAELLVSDLDEGRAHEVASALGGRVVDPQSAYGEPCDVFAPCATGATMNHETIPQLQCRIVAGSANNQLAKAEDGELLHERGIVYVPDYIVNAGGAIALPMLGRAHGEEEVWKRIRRIEKTVANILKEARDRGESPVHSARRIVDRVLTGKRERPAGARV